MESVLPCDITCESRTQSEYADLLDERSIELKRKEEEGSISGAERAELSAIRQFPDIRDFYLRRLAYKELLEFKKGALDLTHKQKALLFSCRQFPRAGSRKAIEKGLTGEDYTEAKAAQLRKLAMRELLGAKLNLEEKAELCSWRLFPHNRQARASARERQLERLMEIGSAYRDSQAQSQATRLTGVVIGPSVFLSIPRLPWSEAVAV